MDIEKLRQAVIDKRFILSANPNWRDGRACGLSDDETEQKANDALTVVLENIAELVVAYLIGARQSVKSEEVQEAIEQLAHGSWQSSKDGYPITLGDKTIDIAIAALQEYQPWVSVGDRMPTENDADRYGKIQIYWDNGIVDTWNYTALAKHVTKFYDGDLTNVTHWKPLPEAPKGE